MISPRFSISAQPRACFDEKFTATEPSLDRRDQAVARATEIRDQAMKTTLLEGVHPLADDAARPQTVCAVANIQINLGSSRWSKLSAAR